MLILNKVAIRDTSSQTHNKDKKHFDRGCMRLGTVKRGSPKLRRVERVQLPEIKKINKGTQSRIITKRVQLLEINTINEGTQSRIITKREFAELLFENCIDCGRMAAIPQGAFMACKVRRNLERNTVITPMGRTEKTGKENVFNIRSPVEGWELTPLKYNSKLMNSIWGLYNRYSVHNFKKNTDANEGVFGTFVAGWGAIFENAPAPNAVAATVATGNNS